MCALRHEAPTLNCCPGHDALAARRGHPPARNEGHGSVCYIWTPISTVPVEQLAYFLREHRAPAELQRDGKGLWKRGGGGSAATLEWMLCGGHLTGDTAVNMVLCRRNILRTPQAGGCFPGGPLPLTTSCHRECLPDSSSSSPETPADEGSRSYTRRTHNSRKGVGVHSKTPSLSVGNGRDRRSTDAHTLSQSRRTQSCPRCRLTPWSLISRQRGMK